MTGTTERISNAVGSQARDGSSVDPAISADPTGGAIVLVADPDLGRGPQSPPKYRLSELPTFEEVLAGHLRDPAFRAEWERTAFARAVSLLVLRYRSTHDLSQTALAKRLGMSQPAVARLELGEHNPTIETLARLAAVLDVEIVLDLVPGSKRRALLSQRAAQNEIGRFSVGGSSVTVAAA